MWNDLKQYIRKQRYTLTAIVISFVVFYVVLFLYQTPTEAALYGIVLVSVVEGLFLSHGFGKFRRKKDLVGELAVHVEETGLELCNLPEPEDALEESYQQLAGELTNTMAREKSRTDKEKQDMVEYYTLWAHQIKTPIAAMSLLLWQQEDSEEKGELTMELFQIEQYVEMVLQYLRLGSESSDMVFREYDLDECIRQAVRKYAKSFIRKKISLNFKETGQKVITDEKWLVFVLEQLLSNALKYTKTGTIGICWENNGLCIEDTGIGISPEDLPRIFEKGYTGYNGRKDKKSTGIGLYLCRQILSRLSWEISVTSVLGKGTQVCLRPAQEKLEFD